MQQYRLRIPKERIEEVDELVQQGEYPNRSEAIKDACRQMLRLDASSEYSTPPHESVDTMFDRSLSGDEGDKKQVSQVMLALSETCPEELTNHLKFLLLLIKSEYEMVQDRALRAFRNVFQTHPEAFTDIQTHIAVIIDVVDSHTEHELQRILSEIDDTSRTRSWSRV